MKHLVLFGLALLLVPIAVLSISIVSALLEDDAASRATLIARGVSEALNCGVLAAPVVGLFVLIGFVLWEKRRRGETPPPPAPGRDTSWHPPT